MANGWFLNHSASDEFLEKRFGLQVVACLQRMHRIDRGKEMLICVLLIDGHHIHHDVLP